MLCLDNVLIFLKIFDKATDTSSSTYPKNILPNTWGKQIWLFWFSYTPINIKWNNNPYVINVKVTLKILT